MEQFYLEIRSVHIAAVILSGSLFAIRSLSHNLLGAQWSLASSVRIISYIIDTILLTAALMLMTIVQQFPFVDGWLTVKVLLLVAYIIIGWWAFRAKRSRSRIACSLAAIAVFGFIITVARTHDPLGLFSTI